MAGICIGTAMVISLVSGWRFWRQQNAMARGKVHVGGWEVYFMGVVGIVVSNDIQVFVF
jgi:hypothetical protein